LIKKEAMLGKHLRFFICILISFSSILSAQVVEPDTLWTKTYGGEEADIGASVQHTVEGGYIICGYTESFGSGEGDVYLIKTDSVGDTVWTKTYGGRKADLGWWIEETADSGYIVAGDTKSFGAGSSDVWLIRTDVNGDTLWTKTYGGVNSDNARSVRITLDGGYIVCGASSSFHPSSDNDVYLIKTDSHGDTLWTRTYGDFGEDAGLEVQQTRDHGYIIVGETENVVFGDIDVYVLKTDSLGGVLWTKVYGKLYDDNAYSVYQIDDEGYIIAGYTQGAGIGEDIWLLRLDANGDTVWVKQYGDTGDEEGGSVFQTSDGGYIICGYSNSYGTNHDAVYLIRTDSLGAVLWTKVIGSDDTENRGFSLQIIDKGEYILTGYSYSNSTLWDVYLVRLGSPPGVTENNTAPRPSHNHGATIISGPLILPADKNYTIYDITGRTVDLTNLTRGIYFIEIDGQIVHKIIKVR
jgi:hypothetical protein